MILLSLLLNRIHLKNPIFREKYLKILKIEILVESATFSPVPVSFSRTKFYFQDFQGTGDSEI